MQKICLTWRDELIFIDLRLIAYFQANGNYTNLTYISGQKQMLTIGLSKLEESLRKRRPDGGISPFVRLGRSIIINQSYLYSISVPNQRLTLSDFEGHSHVISVSKPILKRYKDLMSKDSSNR